MKAFWRWLANGRQRTLVVCLSILTCAMFGFGFALVPIYNSLCKTLGINGKVPLQPVAIENQNTTVKHNDKRHILVEFVATNHAGVPWRFYPKTSKITVQPGTVTRLAFYAENVTGHRMTVQAIPSVTPGIAAKYIKKTECFCFTKQTLNGHEAMNMPLLFYVDKDLPKQINTITLSYTLFDVTGKR